jgi:peptidoglycan/LPS O-acetylase OafA/YrhL
MKNSFATWLQKKFVFPSSGQHWDCLDGLRGMAILMVVCAHAFHYTSPNIRYAGWPRVAHAFLGAGHLGVQVFFVLSGFLISQPFFAAKHKDPQFWYLDGYATRRFLKIIPPYYLIILLFSIFYYFGEENVSQLKYGILWLTGIPDFMNIPNAFSFNPVFWSLWVEVGFYVLLPIFFLIFRKCSYWKTGGAIVLILLIAPFLTRQMGSIDPTNFLFRSARFPNGLTNFSWGVLFSCIYSVVPRDARYKEYLASFGYLGIACLVSTMLLDAKYYLLTERISFEVPLHLSGVSAFFALFFAFNPSTLGARFFSIPFIRYLGLVSYEWFLLHFIMLDRFRAWMGGIPYSTKNLGHYLFVALVPMLCSLLLAILIYHCFSMPLIRWGRSRLAAKRK